MLKDSGININVKAIESLQSPVKFSNLPGCFVTFLHSICSHGTLQNRIGGDIYIPLKHTCVIVYNEQTVSTTTGSGEI
jgi:hypothetical protein